MQNRLVLRCSEGLWIGEVAKEKLQARGWRETSGEQNPSESSSVVGTTVQNAKIKVSWELMEP